MVVYEKTHYEKFKSYDERIIRRIELLSADITVQKALQDLWHTETADQEIHSLNIWTRKERFLSKKRHEDL